MSTTGATTRGPAAIPPTLSVALGLSPDETRYVTISYRQKGSEVRGSLCKGAVASAYTKRSIGSIPARMETVLYPQESLPVPKGFGSNAFRFSESHSEVPGPGTYLDPSKLVASSLRLVSDSYSRKGYGNGFISQRERFRIENYLPYQVPGPGSYRNEPMNAISPTKSALTEADAVQIANVSERYKNKESPVFVPSEGNSHRNPGSGLPGPGTYNISRSLSESPDYKSTAPFRSHDVRFLSKKQRTGPGPGQYELDMQGMRRSLAPGVLGPEISATSCFHKPSGARRVKVNLYDPFESLEQEERRPGPGQYTVDSDTIQRRVADHPAGSSMFTLPQIVDRFGVPKLSAQAGPSGSSPGPGQYFVSGLVEERREKAAPVQVGEDELRDGKKFAGSTAFRSEVRRNAHLSGARGPGPAFYSPQVKPRKEIKNTNPGRDWI